ncbi:MAG: metallophosphoesterase [Deltaproteobacteria bacterium]|nr:metallophosphoesterase [Deltaproteobacteria bacterium]
MLRFALFIVIAVGIVAGLHHYLWLRLVRDTALAGGVRTAATAAICGLGAALPVSVFVGRALPWPGARIVLWPIYVWMGLMFLVFFLLLAVDATRLVGWALGQVLPPIKPSFDPGRRIALARLTGGGAALVASALGAVATRDAARAVGVQSVRVRLARLPRSMHGTTIVQLTDLHVGSLQGQEFVERVVARVNALEPDVVVITGDLIDGTVERLREAVAPIGRLVAKHGVFFVTGNHEYYVSNDQVSGWREWAEELARLGVRVLHNERVSIGQSDAGFDLAGVPDWSARAYGADHAPDLGRALAGRDRARAVVLLAHQPKAIHESARHGVDLQLSGHTHGGQIWPWRYLVRLDQPFVSGLGRVGDTRIYVSRGAGTWGPPMRLGEPAEITRVVLESDA